jgi:hypothetical protein
MTPSVKLKAALCAVAVAAGLLLTRDAGAAIREKPMLDRVNNTLAAIRFLYRDQVELEDRLLVVRAAREATVRQLEAERALVQAEIEKGNKERAALYKQTVTRLETQISELDKLQMEKMITGRIALIDKQIEGLRMDLDTRITEYNVLFGKKLMVDLNIRAEEEKRKGKRANPAEFLDLDYGK